MRDPGNKGHKRTEANEVDGSVGAGRGTQQRRGAERARRADGSGEKRDDTNNVVWEKRWRTSKTTTSRDAQHCTCRGWRLTEDEGRTGNGIQAVARHADRLHCTSTRTGVNLPTARTVSAVQWSAVQRGTIQYSLPVVGYL